jgi:CRP/FNR family transcriptional regulator
MLSTRVCIECAVRDRALCGSLSDDELIALNRIGQRRKVARGETLIWAGDDSVICANLLDGILKLSASTTDGREQTVGLLYPADFVGRPFADEAGFTVTALTDAELCIFPRKQFEGVLNEHVHMERLLLERTFAALEDARGRMLMLARRSAEERIAGFLLDMADRAAGSGCRASRFGPVTFDLPLSRSQIAELLGLTIETVSRQLTKLKTAGIIALPSLRAVTVRDRDALELRADAVH